MKKDEKYSILVTWTKDNLTKSEIVNNYPLSMDESKLMLQKVRKTVFPKGTTSSFDIILWKQTE